MIVMMVKVMMIMPGITVLMTLMTFSIYIASDKMLDYKIDLILKPCLNAYFEIILKYLFLNHS